jgi:hypothetical protein
MVFQIIQILKLGNNLFFFAILSLARVLKFGLQWLATVDELVWSMFGTR